MDEPDTEATEPDAPGRVDAVVVEDPGAAALLELGALEQPATRTANAPRTTTPSRAFRPDRALSGPDHRSFMDAPRSAHQTDAVADRTGSGLTSSRSCFGFPEKPR
jgi:hypothetical protein